MVKKEETPAMKLIEALKEIKELLRKADDLKDKVSRHSAYLNYETPTYKDHATQTKQISEWIQGHSDILKQVLRLRVALQMTNLMTNVTIKLDGKAVTKSIAEWIHRRRDLADHEASIWKKLTDRGLKEGKMKESTDQVMEIKIMRCFDPAEKDKKLDQYTSEPNLIDASLEIANATTDLIQE